MIFPILPSQRQGVEDLRLVELTEDDGRRQIVGTYTAFDGLNVRQELLHGIDFRSVAMRRSPAEWPAKGMALFPRRIGGRYVMLGRQDNENIWLLELDDLYQWDHGRPIISPVFFWEFVQLGNCGSPIEIDEGGWYSRTVLLWHALIASVPACWTRTIPRSSWPVRACRCSFRLLCRSAADMCRTWCIAAAR